MLKKHNSYSIMSNKIIIPLAIVIIGIVGFLGYSMGTNNQNQSTAKLVTNSSSSNNEVKLTKSIETPEKNSSGEFISQLAEFKVKTETDKYTITYPRGKFKSEELGLEVRKVLDKTNMSDTNKFSIVGGVGLNEGFYSDTTSECGLTDPSSAWCFRLSNDKDNKLVNLTIQKGKF